MKCHRQNPTKLYLPVVQNTQNKQLFSFLVQDEAFKISNGQGLSLLWGRNRSFIYIIKLCISPHRPGFLSRRAHVGFVVSKVTLGQANVVSVIPSMIVTHIHLSSYFSDHKEKEAKPGNL
jgi:hypothetical protein